MALFLRICVACVWLFHGIYSKILNQIPRHQEIVARILGEEWRGLTPWIGVLEVMMGLWVLSAWRPRLCALAQTASIVFMNALEIALARDLLLHAPGMVALNALLLAAAWTAAIAKR